MGKRHWAFFWATPSRPPLFLSPTPDALAYERLFPRACPTPPSSRLSFICLRIPLPYLVTLHSISVHNMELVIAAWVSSGRHTLFTFIYSSALGLHCTCMSDWCFGSCGAGCMALWEGWPSGSWASCLAGRSGKGLGFVVSIRIVHNISLLPKWPAFKPLTTIFDIAPSSSVRSLRPSTKRKQTIYPTSPIRSPSHHRSNQRFQPSQSYETGTKENARLPTPSAEYTNMRSPHTPLAASVLQSSKSVTIAHGLGLSHALIAHRYQQLISLPPPPSLIHPSTHPAHPFQPTTTIIKPPSSPPNPPSSSSTTRTTSPNPPYREICLSKLPYSPQPVTCSTTATRIIYLLERSGKMGFFSCWWWRFERLGAQEDGLSGRGEGCL